MLHDIGKLSFHLLEGGQADEEEEEARQDGDRQADGVGGITTQEGVAEGFEDAAEWVEVEEETILFRHAADGVGDRASVEQQL